MTLCCFLCDSFFDIIVQTCMFILMYVHRRFRDGKKKVLVKTNLCPCGIDIEQVICEVFMSFLLNSTVHIILLQVTLVVNYDISTDATRQPDCETYLHRIGCTGRSEYLYVYTGQTHNIAIYSLCVPKLSCSLPTGCSQGHAHSLVHASGRLGMLQTVEKMF